MKSERDLLWTTDAMAKALEARLLGFWNPDYVSQILLPLLGLPERARILDVGSGNGSLTLLLARLLPDSEFIGVDITPKMVSDAQTQAAALALHNVKFREADAVALPFEDGEFDAAVCQTLLAHLPDPMTAIREMSRVIRHGGSFMAAEWHTVGAEWPIDRERMALSNADAMESAKLVQMFVNGYRDSGQGDLRIGGQVPFLANDAGLEVVDVRINDRVPHAFPPYRAQLESAALMQAREWATTFEDSAWRSWLAGAIAAGGGSAADADRFVSFLPQRQREAFARARETGYAFVWLMNPVLLVTVARKPPV